MDRIAEVQADIAEALGRDRGQRFRHAVDERLDADEAGLRVALGLSDQMFTATKADLETQLAHPRFEQTCERGRTGAEIKRQARQQRIEQRRLLRLQPVACAPPEEGALLTIITARA